MMRISPEVFDYFGMSSLSDKDKIALLRALNDELELRVGSDLADGLSDKDISDFEEIMCYIEKRDLQPEDDPAVAWLKLVRPNYRTVVIGQLRQLLETIYSNRETICSEAGVSLQPSAEDPVRQALDHVIQGSPDEDDYHLGRASE